MSSSAALRSGPLEWLREARTRLLANPAFRRKAASLPLSRQIARQHAAEAFDLCAGFVYSQVLLACVRLHLLDMLAERPQSLPVLARRLGLGEERAARLLAAATAVGLASREGGDRFGLGRLGASIAGDPGIAAMIEHNALLYADLADPVALLRGERGDTALARYWPYAAGPAPAGLTDASVAPYSALMAASQPLVAQQVVTAYPFARHRCLLDVGAGEGAFIAAVAPHAPQLRFLAFDLPAVAQRARGRLEGAGLGARVTVVGGDFLRDPLPAGADLVTLVRVLHDHEDAAAAQLLARVRAALPAGGVVLVAEPLRGGAQARMADAYFGIYFLAMGRGQARSFAELAGLMEGAGFARVRHRRTDIPLQTSVITAEARD